MNKKNLFLSVALSSCMIIPSAMTPIFAEEKVYEPGVTVEKNTNEEYEADYQVPFVYEDKDEKDAVKVSVAGNFSFYDLEEKEVKEYYIDNDIGDATVYGPYDYKKGMINTGYNVKTSKAIDYELIETKNERFEIKMPLPGNLYYYDYIVTYDDGTVKTIQDPMNPSPKNHTNGHDANHSIFYVGDKDNTIKGQEYIYPRTDGKTGTYSFVEYEAVDGTKQPLGIYLPYGYDSTKTYKTIYVSHGGGLMDGSSNELSYYTGEYFVEREDVVFVSVNHRLNVLGYLDLSEYGDQYANSGNIGMEDCVESLKWVQANIEKFGGDPKNVTIIGQSSGGTKVITLACMSDTVDLFQRVVMWSGGYSQTNTDAGKANTKKLIEYLKLSKDHVIPTLTSMSYEDLLSAATKAGISYSTYYGYGTFESPLFDENGKMNKYAAQREWMVGTTYSEFSNNAVPLTTHTYLLDPSASYTIEDIQNDFYLPNIDNDHAMELLTKKYGDSTKEIAEEYSRVYSDHKLAEALFLNSMPKGGLSRYGLINENDGLLKLFNDNGIEVYNYLVNYTQPYFGGTVMHHTGDIPYWFNSLDEVEYMIKGDENEAYDVSNEMADALAAFIKTGNPSIDNLEWKTYTNNEHNTMIFDRTSEYKKDFDTHLYDLIMNASAGESSINLKRN